MRELEFLPPSYHQTHRRKRVVAFQGWIFIVLILGLGTWVGLAQHNVRATESAVAALQQQLDLTHADQRDLAEKENLLRKLKDQEQLIASLGYHVDMTRLLQTMDSLMPKEMSLLEFECTTEEQPRQAASVAAVRTPADAHRDMDRRLRVRLRGLAPSDQDFANFLTGVGNVPFFDQVSVKYARDISDNGHILREFEVTFAMSLN